MSKGKSGDWIPEAVLRAVVEAEVPISIPEITAKLKCSTRSVNRYVNEWLAQGLIRVALKAERFRFFEATGKAQRASLQISRPRNRQRYDHDQYAARIVEMVNGLEFITARQISQELGIREGALSRLLNQLVEENKIRRAGPRVGYLYLPAQQQTKRRAHAAR